MSDRNDFFGDENFDNEELFGDEGDEYGAGWDIEGGGEDTIFADDEDFAFADEETPDFDEAVVVEERDEGLLFGLNRTFVIIGGVIAVVVCLGIVGLLAIIQANAGPSDIDLTVTAVYVTNTYVAYALELTETQNAINAAETATAESWTDTPTPSPTFTPTPSATPTTAAPPTIEFVTPTPDQAAGGLDPGGVAATATALAQILSGAGATPTPEEGLPGGDGQTFVTLTPGPLATALPDTGLFDNGFANGAGVSGLLTAGLAALGLAAVIAVSRWLRSQ